MSSFRGARTRGSNRFIRTIRLDNILSYGSSTAAFPMEALNVLIGPNASGKSNLIEVLSLLAATPTRDFQAPIREGGGVRDWLWKGASHLPAATIDITVEYPNGPPLRYRLSFTESGARFQLMDEAVENEQATRGNEEPYFYYRYQEGHPMLNVFTQEEPRLARHLERDDVKPEQSILSQRRDPDSYPELTYLADKFERMFFYREWNLGRSTPPSSAADRPSTGPPFGGRIESRFGAKQFTKPTSCKAQDTGAPENLLPVC